MAALVLVAAGGCRREPAVRLVPPGPLRPQAAEPGVVVDSWRGVWVYANGPEVAASHGLHHAADGYYYGQQWQCVEFAKRFYKRALGHAMPEVMGHACEFWDEAVPQGGFNAARGLWQYRNGEDDAPRADDLMVWASAGYGHLAVVTRTGPGWVEVVQQNMKYPRQRLVLSPAGGCWRVGGQGALGPPAGWLRVGPKESAAESDAVRKCVPPSSPRGG